MFRNALFIFLVFLLAKKGEAIRCYSWHGYMQKALIVDEKLFCTAHFWLDGSTVLSGHSSYNLLFKVKHEFPTGNECHFEKHRMHEDDEWSEMHTCVCYENLCNDPINWKQFESKGHRLPQ